MVYYYDEMEDDIYSEDRVNRMLDDDEITSEEAAFLAGYEEAG